jgi:hypothetical protein
VSKQSSRADGDKLIAVTVKLTMPELSAVGRAAVVVTSPFDTPTARAAERGLGKFRDAAKNHPDAPGDLKGQWR